MTPQQFDLFTLDAQTATPPPASTQHDPLLVKLLCCGAVLDWYDVDWQKPEITCQICHETQGITC